MSTPIEGQYNSTLPTVNSGQNSIIQITAKGAPLSTLADPATGYQATITAFHNADNQMFTGTTYGLFTGGVAQLKNVANGLDRQAETGPDNIPSLGVATGTQQMASPITISSGQTVSAGSLTFTVGTPSQLKATNRGVAAWIQIGSVLIFEPGTTNQESVVVTSINYGTGVVGINGLGNGGSNIGFKNTHTASYTITSYSYNQARDATLPDGSTGQGISASATFLFNATSNSGTGGWEAERSFSGELNGASGVGSAIAVEYEDTAGGPILATGLASGLRLQAGQNLLGKGKLAKTITSTLVGDTNLVFSSAANTNLVLAGAPIQLSGSGTLEIVYVAQSWTPGSSATVPLQNSVVNATQTTATFDVNAPNGPGLNGFLPNGIAIEEEALYNPADGFYYVERSATNDAMAGANIVAESPALYNGSTFDRGRSGSGATLSGKQSVGAELITTPGNWTANNVPATATQATITKAAGGAGVYHVCNSITATIACGATAQTPIQVYLRDGATGAGTIIWAGTLAAPANGSGIISVSGLNIIGSANTAMTLEFSGAGVAASQEVVTLGGYDAI